jgi:DNA primase
MNIEHVDFPEAMRMLADRAGIALESPAAAAPAPAGPTKTELLAGNAWAEGVFAKALRQSAEGLEYLGRRGLTPESIERFRLGYAPPEHGWLLAQARGKGWGIGMLEHIGLAAPAPDAPGLVRERFRGRLIFPIHDDRGRAIGFGGRILPEAERRLAEAGKHVAKYLNSPETALFHKRTVLYAADLARGASREAGWVAVVEGYTDVIAAHQQGVCNVVGTLGTALGEDHLRALRRLCDRVVLVFDGDEAGRSAADRALEFFLGSDLDLRVLTLPPGLDPCEYFFQAGADAFRALAEQAADPISYMLGRAAARFDLNSEEGTRRAAEWVVGIMSRVSESRGLGLGLEVKEAKALDTLSHRLRVPLESLKSMRRQMRRSPARGGAAASTAVSSAARGVAPEGVAFSPSIRQGDLDRHDLELIQIALAEPAAVSWLLPRVGVSSLRDAPLRAILQACYELESEGQSPSYANLMVRLEDPAVRALAASLVTGSALSVPDPGRFRENVRPAPWRERLEGMLIVLEKRQRHARLKDLKRSLDETDEQSDPEAYRALQLEYHRLLTSGRVRKP